MKTYRIKRSVLAGALCLTILGSQSMEILTASAASEELEYEGTTQISSTDYYPAFDTMSTALTVEEVYVEAGSSVQEGDAILKLTEDSYQSALDYYQAAIIRATNDLTNEELAYAQGMQSAEYDLELALAYEEQAEFVQEQSEAELSDTIDEHEELLTEMEERIEELENGEYDSEEEAEEAMSASGISGTDVSGSGMSGSGGGSMGNASEGDLLGETKTGDDDVENPGESSSTEEKTLEQQITELESDAESLQKDLNDYQNAIEKNQADEKKLKDNINKIEDNDNNYDTKILEIKKKVDEYNSILSEIYKLLNLEDNDNNYDTKILEIKEKVDEYNSILSDIYELLGLEEEAELTALSYYDSTGSALESVEETYEDPQVIEEPLVEEPQIEEPQVEEPQIEEPQIEEPQVNEPEEISGKEAADSIGENSGAEESEDEGTLDETEDETETETEEWDGIFDPEHPEKGGLLTVQISGGTITLEIPENAFTEAVSLQVEELTASYEALLNGAVDAEDTALLYAVLNKAYENREGTWEDTDDQIYDFYLLDLSFINQEGAVVEPAAAIQVTMDHSAAPVNVGVAQADMGRTTEDLYRMAGGAVEAVGSQIGLTNNGISFLSFIADSFSSPYVVLMIETEVKEETGTEFESVREEEEVNNETEELISTLSATDGRTETDEETKEQELYDVLGKLYKELVEEGEDDDVLQQLEELLDQLDKEGVSLELLLDLDDFLTPLKAEGKGGDSMDKAIDLLYEIENIELKELVSKLQSQNDELEEKIEELQSKQDELEEKIEELQSKQDELEGLIEELQSNQEDLEGLIDALSNNQEDLEGLIEELQSKQDELEGWISELNGIEESIQEYYNKVVEDRKEERQGITEIINDFGSLDEQIKNLKQTVAQEGQDFDNQEKAASAGSALTGAEQETAESAAAGLTDQSDLSALAGMSGMSGMDASSMANMSDTEALQMAEEELAAGLGESAVSGEGVLDVQSILGAQESESMFGDKYDLTEAKSLLERKATDADEAEELLDDLYPMQESVQLEYEELLRLRKTLKLEIQYQYDETLLSARLAEITYDQTTKELEKELRAAMENLTDLEEEFQELEDLEDGTVKAAASGTLSAVYYEAEDTLFAAYPMYSIYDTDTVTVLIAVPQSEIEKISVGEEVEVSLSSFGTTQGTVTEKAVEPQEGTSRTTVNYEVEISIDNSSGRLSSGTAVTVTVTEA